MNKIFDPKFNATITYIIQGEYYIGTNSDIVSTTLGSCVAVCLFDKENKIGAMNHYMLPEPAIENDSIQFEKAKYGINAMEMMINEMLKKGANRNNLKAKIFGGANMFKAGSSLKAEVGRQNVDFANKYLKMENIQILSEDVLKDHARKIYFDTAFGNVKLYRIGDSATRELEQKEQDFKRSIIDLSKKAKKEPDIKDDDDKITFF